MSLSKKDRAKLNYLNSNEGNALKQTVNKRGINLSQISDDVLPDDFEFEGWKVLDGKFYKTAGEYKAAVAKKYNY